MTKAYATYTNRNGALIIDLDIPGGVGRSFRLDRGRNETADHHQGRAYAESDRWAEAHGARLESFRPSP